MRGLVRLRPASHPEASEDDVAEDERASAHHHGLAGHSAVSDNGGARVHKTSHVHGSSAGNAVETELSLVGKASSGEDASDGSLVSEDGVLDDNISTKVHEASTSLGEVRALTDDVDGLDAAGLADLDDGLTDTGSSAVLDDDVSGLKVDEILEHTECSAGVHHDGGDVLDLADLRKSDNGRNHVRNMCFE